MSHNITYSQNREDLFIKTFLADVENGFYIDVGAHHPVEASVTKFFYERGWSGINIEPQTEMFELLQEDRPRDVNLKIAISNNPGKLTLRQYGEEYQSSGISTINIDKVHDAYVKQFPEQTKIYKDYEVNVDTIDNVIAKYAKNKKIHFLKIDVEGYELEVLMSIDLRKNRPILIVIEADHVVEPWKHILIGNKYSLAFFDGLNEYYLADEEWSRREEFSFTNEVLLKGDFYDYKTYKKISGLERDKEFMNRVLAEQSQKSRDESVKQKRNKEFLEGKIRGLEAEIKRPKRLVEASKELARAVHHTNIAVINKIQPKPKKGILYKRINKNKHATAVELVQLISDYDRINKEALDDSAKLTPRMFVYKTVRFGYIRSFKGAKRVIKKIKGRK